jgi:hypothetical protein
MHYEHYTYHPIVENFKFSIRFCCLLPTSSFSMSLPTHPQTNMYKRQMIEVAQAAVCSSHVGGVDEVTSSSEDQAQQHIDITHVTAAVNSLPGLLE